MSPEEALFLLAKVHTQDDPAIGFVVRMGAMPEPMFDGPPERYIAAWKVVREVARLRTEPGQYPK